MDESVLKYIIVPLIAAIGVFVLPTIFLQSLKLKIKIITDYAIDDRYLY